MKIKPFAVAAIFITIASYVWFMAENNAGFSDSMFNYVTNWRQLATIISAWIVMESAGITIFAFLYAVYVDCTRDTWR